MKIKANVNISTRDGRETGLSTGSHRRCLQDGCRGVRIAVRWPDGRTTWPCSKGIYPTSRGLRIA